MKSAEYFKFIWNVLLTTLTLLELHSRCFASQLGLVCSPVLGAPSGKDDTSLNFPWRRLKFHPMLCQAAV